LRERHGKSSWPTGSHQILPAKRVCFSTRIHCHDAQWFAVVGLLFTARCGRLEYALSQKTAWLVELYGLSQLTMQIGCPNDPAQSTTTVTVGTASFTYGGLNYMASYGSSLKQNYDFRWPTDGPFNAVVGNGFNAFLDGTSTTVVMSETVRSDGADMTLPVGQTPIFPYTFTLNGSTGVNSTLNATQGMTSSGGGWATYVNSPGMINNPDLSMFWRTFTNCRGGSSPALRGRGTSWAFSGAINSMTNGYHSPNNRIPDLVTHFTRYFAPRSYHH